MKVGFTGHQKRPGIDWAWVVSVLRKELSSLLNIEAAYSSLAAGGDQLFAEVALELSIPLIGVVPLDDYESHFESRSDLLTYRRLLGQATVIRLGMKGDPERAFFSAGKYIVEHCHIVLAVWDGKPAEGLGGTADVVEYARSKGKTVVHIDPTSEHVSRTIRGGS
jgi:hypothetical protein